MTTTTAAPRIEIPRLPNERAERYEARTLYITMGAARSLNAVRQQIGNGSVRRMEEWSAEDGWVEHARRYDETLANLAAQRAAQQYLDDLDEHRRRFQQSGRALHGVAVEMLSRLRQSAAVIEYTPAALATIARALTVAADLEAHALGVADLLGRVVREGGGDGD